MLVTFIGLVITGMPQKFAADAWAKGIVLIVGGVERVRFIHHALGTIMAFQLLWHVVEAVWLHLVQRRAMPMVPQLADVKDFVQQVKFNLGWAKQPPRMDRYTFAEKLEYLALVWGTAVMVLTGLVLLYPVRWSMLFPGEWILAAKAAHGGEAVLAFLSILTWHVYFVHVRHWNTAIFTREARRRGLRRGAPARAGAHPPRRGPSAGAGAALAAGGVRGGGGRPRSLGLAALMVWLRGTGPGLTAFKVSRFLVSAR